MVEPGRDIEIKPLLVPPRLRTLEGRDGRRASYLELFFDLVFVVAIAQLAHELGARPLARRLRRVRGALAARVHRVEGLQLLRRRFADPDDGAQVTTVAMRVVLE